MPNDLFKKAAIFGLSIVTAVGLSGAVFAAPTAQAQSLTQSQVDSILSLLESFGADQATVDDVNAALTGQPSSGGTTGGSSGTTPACDFDRSLSQGMSGSDVMCLQRYLNNSGYTVSASGVGSAGNETEYFGPRTHQAVVAWQNANATDVLQPVGLSSGTGYWGPSSIAHYNALLSQAQAGDDADDGDDVSVSGDDWMMVNVQDDSGFAHDKTFSVTNNAQGVEYWKVEVTAAEDGELDSLTFDRRGVGTNSDFGNFYLFQDDTRITNGRTMNSDTHEVEFSNLNIDLDAGDETTLTLVANMSTSNTGNENYVELVDHDANGVDLSDWEGSTGYRYRISGSAGGSVTFASSGSAADPNLGEQSARLGKFQLNSVSGEDINVDRIILEQNGSVDADALEDFELVNSSGDVVASADMITTKGGDDLLSLVFDDDFAMDEGDTETFTLRGDVTAGADSGDTIQFRMEEAVDLLATGEDYGYGVAAKAGGGNFPENLQSLTIQGGQVTFTFDNTPSTRSVLVGGDEVSLLDFTLSVEEFTEVDTLPIKFYASNDGDGDAFDSGSPSGGGGLVGTSTNNLTSLKLVDRDTGSTVSGPFELPNSTDGVQTVDFDDVWFMDAGETRQLSVVVDIDNNTAADTEFGAGLALNDGDLTIEDINGDSISDIVPSSEIQGNTQTAVDSDLSVGLSSSPTSDTVISGSSDFKAVGFRFSAGSASDVTITDLTVQAYVDGDTSGSLSKSSNGDDGTTTPSDVIQSVTLEDSSGNQIGSAEGLDSNEQAVFDDVSITVDAGNNKTVYAVVNIASNAPLGSSNDRISLDIDSTGDVTAEDVDGDTVNLNSANPNNDTSPSVVHEVIGQGQLTLSRNGSTAKSGIVMAGASEQGFLSVDFDTVYEGFEIQKMRISTTTNGVSDEFGDLYVYDDSGNLLKQGTMDTNGVWQLSDESNGLFSITEDETIHIRADISSHNTANKSGADSGDEPQLRVHVDDQDSGNTAFKAVGLDSGNSLTEGDSDLTVNENTDIDGSGSSEIVGEKMLIRRALPTVSLNSLSNTIGAGSNQKLIDMNVASESGGDTVSVKRFVFEIDVSDAGNDNNNDLTLADWKWYEGGSNETSNVTITHVASGTEAVGNDLSSVNLVQSDGTSQTHYVMVAYDNGQELEVGAGSNQDVSLRAGFSNVDSGDDAVTVSLVNDDTNFSNNYHDYFVGEESVNSDVLYAASGSDAIVFYDVDGSGDWNGTSTDIAIAASGTSAYNNIDSSNVASSSDVNFAVGTSTVVFHDVDGDDTYDEPGDLVLASSTNGDNMNGVSATSTNLDRVADGNNLTVYYEVESSDGNLSSTDALELDSGDLSVVDTSGSTGHTDVSNDTDIAGYTTSEADGDLNFVWSDDSASSHGTNTADWMNGYRVNEPTGVLSDISHTRS